MMLFAFSLPEMGSSFHVALMVGSLCFLYQLYLLTRLLWRLITYRRILRGPLGTPAELIGDDQARGRLGHFPWLHWLLPNLPANTSEYSREVRQHVLKELDWWFAKDPHYLFLQRTAVMAPLIGVLITVEGFISLRIPSAEVKTIEEMLRVVTPLIVGVGVGAALALINQVLLHCAGLAADGVRADARMWFDRSVRMDAVEKAPEVAAQAVRAFADASQALNESAKHYSENSEVVKAATDSIGEAVVSLHETLAELHAAAEKSSEVITSLVQAGSRAVKGLGQAVKDFAGSADQHRMADSQIISATKELSDCTAVLRSGCEEFQRTVSSEKKVLESLHGSIRKDLLPSFESLRDMAARFENSVESWSQHLQTLSSSVNSVATQVSALAPKAQAALSQMKSAVDGFCTMLDDAGKSMAASSTNDVVPAQRKLHHAAGQFAKAVQGMGQLRETLDQLAGAVESIQELAITQQSRIIEGFPEDEIRQILQYLQTLCKDNRPWPP